MSILHNLIHTVINLMSPRKSALHWLLFFYIGRFITKKNFLKTLTKPDPKPGETVLLVKTLLVLLFHLRRMCILTFWSKLIAIMNSKSLSVSFLTDSIIKLIFLLNLKFHIFRWMVLFNNAARILIQVRFYGWQKGWISYCIKSRS